MIINIAVTSALISSAIASLITFFLKNYFDKRLEYNFNKKIEELKVDLSIHSDLVNQYITRRLDIYPKLVELVYRLRNELRDICRYEDLPLPQALSFMKYADQFTDEIYRSRLDLERDQIFISLHSFKDIARDVKNELLDWIELNAEGNDIDHLRRDIQQKYQLIERQHKMIIRDLTKLTTTTGNEEL